MNIKIFDEKALQKVFKNSAVLVFNNRTHIIIHLPKQWKTVS